MNHSHFHLDITELSFRVSFHWYKRRRALLKHLVTTLTTMNLDSSKPNQRTTGFSVLSLMSPAQGPRVSHLWYISDLDLFHEASHTTDFAAQILGPKNPDEFRACLSSVIIATALRPDEPITREIRNVVYYYENPT